MSSREAFFGGTFDPVHHGHLIVARSILERSGVDRVSFVPTGLPPHKAAMHAPAEHRLAMLQLAVHGHASLGVCDIELRRPGRSFTYDTLCQLRAENAGVQPLWVIGMDMLEDLPRWHRAGELVREFDFLVAARPTWQDRLPAITGQLVANFGQDAADRLTSNILPTPLIEISSTDIRARAAAGKDISWLLPEPVAAYIQEHSLYRP